ncbi:exosortase/archaeosortase family protein [Candidatus Woesebacteria bacterium]|nr:MAG: exosortase/archaeosortase family protein [Candidatus Woesebacteria bacterium]
MNQKKVFKDILIVTAIVLSLLPVIVTFSAILTTLFDKLSWYVWLQREVVPVESRMVAVLVKVVGIDAQITSHINFSMVLTRGETIIPVQLEWNCLGWQSMILLVTTFVTGLRGRYKLSSKIETVIIGILGTFLSNLFRMAFIVTLAYYWNSFAAMIIHDYFASFIAVAWMLFFWWFSYSYVLDEKIESNLNEVK